MSDRAETLLRASGVGLAFRGLQALADYDLTLPRGEIVGVIGPNGAGKTTLFNAVTGFLPPTSGRITLRDREIGGLPAHRIAALGIARTFQNSRPLARLTVLENELLRPWAEAGLVSPFLALGSIRP